MKNNITTKTGSPDTTVLKVTIKRKLEMSKLAWKLSESDILISWTALCNYCLENYGEEAMRDIKEKTELNEKIEIELGKTG